MNQTNEFFFYLRIYSRTAFLKTFSAITNKFKTIAIVTPRLCLTHEIGKYKEIASFNLRRAVHNDFQ